MWIGIITANIRYNKELRDKAKLLYAEITARLNEIGEVVFKSDTLSSYLSVSDRMVKSYVDELDKFGYISYKKDNDLYYIELPKERVEVVVEKKLKEVKPTNKRKDIAEKVVEIWNKEFYPGVRGISCTSKLIDTVTARANSIKKNSKSNVVDEESVIIEAIKNRIEFVNNSEWHCKPENSHHKTNIYLVLRSDADLEKHHLMGKDKNKRDDINVFRFS